MKKNKASGSLIGAGLLSAIAASLCCITPVLALMAGASGVASAFAWIEPARPYLIGLSIVVLLIAWYQKLKPVKADDCGCITDEKPKFIQSKLFLLLVTLFAGAMIVFPYYTKIFFPKTDKQVIILEESTIQRTEFKIKGMTCSGCEEAVKQEVNKLQGILKAEISYPNSNATIAFDTTKTTLALIEKAINSTGYKVMKTIPK